MGEYGVILEHHADVPLVGGQGVDHLFVKADLAPIHRIEAGDHAQQGGFSTAGGTQQGKELPLLDVQADAVDGGEVTIPFHGIFDDNSVAHRSQLLLFRITGGRPEVNRSALVKER